MAKGIWLAERWTYDQEVADLILLLVRCFVLE